jgi:broad specificity phosphatase PhoE
MLVWLIRHGESLGNSGERTTSPIDTPLTDLGKQQAQEVAGYFSEDDPIGLIIASPFIRSQETAEPLCQKMRKKLQVWPIQECTFLAPAKFVNTTHDERIPAIAEYYERADPNYVDGEGAESFLEALERAKSFLDRLSKLKVKNVAAFTHETFIRLVRWSLLHRGPVDSAAVRSFTRLCKEWSVGNCSVIDLYLSDGKWII